MAELAGIRTLFVLALAASVAGCGDDTSESAAADEGADASRARDPNAEASAASPCALPQQAALVDTTITPGYMRASLHYDAATGRCRVVSGLTSPLAVEPPLPGESQGGNYCADWEPVESEPSPSVQVDTPTGLLEFALDDVHGRSVSGFHPATYEFEDSEQASSGWPRT